MDSENTFKIWNLCRKRITGLTWIFPE